MSQPEAHTLAAAAAATSMVAPINQQDILLTPSAPLQPPSASPPPPSSSSSASASPSASSSSSSSSSASASSTPKSTIAALNPPVADAQTAKEDKQKSRQPPNESDLQAWLQGYMNPNASRKSGADGAYLSYDWFIVLAVLGGWFGLDHLYLRSPWSFLAKLIVNSMFFGIWYFYDIIQAFSSKDVIKVYGVGLPGFPAKRVAMGVLAEDEPSPKHSNFFIYALCLFMGGIFGLDAFLVGDRESGIMRLLFLISVIGMPIAFGWWIYKLFRFFTDTPSVVNQYASYFGSEGGGWSMFGSLIDPTSFLGTLLKPVNTAADGFKSAMNTAEETVKLGVGVVKAIGSVGEILATKPMRNPIPTFQEMKEGIDSYKSSAEGIAAQAAQAQAQGGGNQTSSLNILPYTLLGTIALIALSGFVATYYRSKKHVAPQDDRPPEPGVFRKPDSKEYAA